MWDETRPFNACRSLHHDRIVVPVLHISCTVDPSQTVCSVAHLTLQTVALAVSSKKEVSEAFQAVSGHSECC